MDKVGGHSRSHDAGGEASGASGPLASTIEVGHGGEDGFLHIEHARIDGDCLFERPADYGPLGTVHPPARCSTD